MIKEIIFDCFGVLTQDGWTTFVKKYAHEEIMDDLHAANALADKGIISYKEFLERVSKITNVDIAVIHKIINTSLHPNEDIFDLAKKLSQNYSLGIISNVGSPLENYFPKDYLKIFNVQTLSYQESVIKPDPEIFRSHLEKSGFEASETVFIDDRESNCHSAETLGLNAIVYKNVEQLTTELKKYDVKIA